MAGSYNHCVKKDGSLRGPQGLNSMIENGGDVYEAVEEMYGMIWYLANRLNTEEDAFRSEPYTIEEIVEDARKKYAEGLAVSPGPKKPRFG